MLLRVLTFLFICHFAAAQEKTMSIFTPPGDPSLCSVAEKVVIEEITSEEIQGIIEQMYAIARGERGDTEKRVMVGLAAPQIGISKRIILVDLGVQATRRELGNLEVFINPEIVWYSEDQIEEREGCYSVDRHICGIVRRSAKIKIQAFDRKGNRLEKELSGFTARIFQHETDHLNGIRFPDRVGPQGRLHWVKEDQYPEYRDNWETWPVSCPWKVWIDMKAGK